MKEAVDAESMLEYCKAILNAETTEEVEYIKESLANDLRANGKDEEYIQRYFYYLNQTVEKIENEELAFDENGQVVRNAKYTQDGTTIDGPQPVTNMPSQAGTLAGVGLTLTSAALVACMALRNKAKKNKNNKSL